MPNKDGTGPQGKGSEAGRKLGNCSDNQNSKDSNNQGCSLNRRRRRRRCCQ